MNLLPLLITILQQKALPLPLKKRKQVPQQQEQLLKKRSQVTTDILRFMPLLETTP